jgi:hypothetical protein
VGNALHGLQGMSSDVPEVRDVLKALRPHIASCREPLSAQGVGNALYGLLGMSSSVPEERDVRAVPTASPGVAWEVPVTAPVRHQLARGRKVPASSNARRVELALRRVLLGGAHLLERREAAVLAMRGHDHIILSLRGPDASSQRGLRAIYVADDQTGTLRRVWGLGAETLDAAAVRGTFKFDTAARTFIPLPTLALAPSVDAVVLAM